jgi:hypothetical protein
VPLCADLVQLWDRPPTSESRAGRRWLSLARATLAMRGRRFAEAEGHLETAAAAGDGDPRGRIEVALGQAVLESRARPGAIPSSSPRSTVYGDCLRARHAGSLAYALNHAGEVDRAMALHAALPDTEATPAFARSRRANGLGYGHHLRGELEAALIQARRAATFAGDAGHVRLRAMALLMIARVAGDSDEGRDARARAKAIADALDDDTLRRRWAALQR